MLLVYFVLFVRFCSIENFEFDDARTSVPLFLRGIIFYVATYISIGLWPM